MEVVASPEFSVLDPALQSLFLTHIQEHQAMIPAMPQLQPNSMPGKDPSSALVEPSQSVPLPANVTPTNPVVNPGADSFGAA
jgi:hypothetical protein